MPHESLFLLPFYPQNTVNIKIDRADLYGFQGVRYSYTQHLFF